MLAYVFWHRPAEGVDVGEYESRLGEFHATLDVVSSAFRLHALPWRHESGYEDWYLVEDWTALGELNAAAVAAARRGEHDAAARLSADGWGGVYRLLNGPAEPPAGVRWQPDSPGEADCWQRQMNLSPAPEYCVVAPPAGGRERIA